MNLYEYANGDPVNNIDPSGLEPGYWAQVGQFGLGEVRGLGKAAFQALEAATDPMYGMRSGLPPVLRGLFSSACGSEDEQDGNTFGSGLGSIGAIAASGATRAPNATTPTLAEIEGGYNAATAPYKGGPLSAAGRALAKHNPISRAGSVKWPIPRGAPADINALAHDVVSEILTNPGSVRINRGGVIDIVDPSGRGIRFFANGLLKGFLD